MMAWLCRRWWLCVLWVVVGKWLVLTFISSYFEECCSSFQGELDSFSVINWSKWNWKRKLGSEVCSEIIMEITNFIFFLKILVSEDICVFQSTCRHSDRYLLQHCLSVGSPIEAIHACDSRYFERAVGGSRWCVDYHTWVHSSASFRTQTGQGNVTWVAWHFVFICLIIPLHIGYTLMSGYQQVFFAFIHRWHFVSVWFV